MAAARQDGEPLHAAERAPVGGRRAAVSRLGLEQEALAMPGSGFDRDELMAWMAERRAAVAVFGGLLAGSLLFWGGLLVTTGGESPAPLASDGSSAAADDDLGPAQEDTPPAGGQRDGDGTEAAGADDAAAGDADDAGDAAADAEEAEPDDVVVLTLDRQCEVEVGAEERDDPAARQAWRHPECEHAPLDPGQADQRWIVVVGSFTGRETAQARLQQGDHEPTLLWSSHYPSLNPGYWVVYEGPFPDRAAAREAAEAIGAGAYVRQLSAEPPDDTAPSLAVRASRGAMPS